MNTIDILKGILAGNATKSKRIDDIQQRSGGAGSSGGGGLSDILGSVLGGGGTRQAPQQPQRQTRAQAEPSEPGDLGRMLEDMLGVGRGGGGAAPAPVPVPQQREVPRAAPEPAPRQRQAPAQPEYNQAEILVRAMCNAAKVDGNIDQAEQDAILARIGNVGQTEIDFVRSELNAPLDLDGYCRSVPGEVAQRAYAFSVMAIKLDTLNEAAYLGRLAAGLGINPQVCNEIHKQLDAPCLYVV